jgi:hypothetical protein
METVFHDAPTPPGGYILDIEDLLEQPGREFCRNGALFCRFAQFHWRK